MTSSVFLIVVDNPAHRVLFNRYLQTTPHHLVFAFDGEDGFDRFGEVKPDLILVDADVSKLDGTIVTQLIRQQPGGDKVPIILLSVDGKSRNLAWARSVGADALLQVPFERSALLAKIAPLLTVGRSPSTEAGSNEASTKSRAAFDNQADATEIRGGGPLLDFPTHPEGSLGSETPVPVGGEHDMDTVVSFQNPFYESTGAALVDPAIGDREASTPTAATLPLIEPRPTTDIAETVPRVQTVASPDITDLVPRRALDRVPTPVDERSPALGVPVVRSLEAPPVPDPLEEPRIAPAEGSRPNISKSQLIEEVPRDETPSSSGEQRISAIRQRAQGKERRGLDESQLGKRLAKRVRKMFGLLEEVDYYQLLGVERGATQAALQVAYFDLSLEFHPDRFFLLRSGDLKEKIYIIYRRIHEAYRVLSDAHRREQYDQILADRSAKRATSDIRASEDPETGVPNPPSVSLDIEAKSTQGRTFVERAKVAFSLGDYNAARLHLMLAANYDGHTDAIRAALDHVQTHLTPTV